MSKPVAFVTGGGSGIGLACSTHLISRGYRVYIVDLDDTRGNEAAKTLGEECRYEKVDVSNYSQQAHAMKNAFEWGGNRIDLLVANAGIADTQSIYKDGELDEEGLPKPLSLKAVNVNQDAVIQGVWLFRHFARKNKTPGGKVVITSSVVGLYPNYAIPLYATSKHALIGFVRSVAPVFAPENITINAICPTLVETNLMPKQYVHLWDTKQLTPMSTALKAYNAFIDDDTLTGQTVILALDDLVFEHKPDYAHVNVHWMFDQHRAWEEVTLQGLPRPLGQNTLATWDHNTA